jgi:DNA-binding XRE family transcriptional regulator
LPYVRLCFRKERPKPYPTNPTTSGKHLKKRRLTLGRFQKDIAKELGSNHWTYSGWETDRVTPPMCFWPKIIAFLGYDPRPEPKTLGERIKAKYRELGMARGVVARLVQMFSALTVTIGYFLDGECEPIAAARIDHEAPRRRSPACRGRPRPKGKPN